MKLDGDNFNQTQTGLSDDFISRLVHKDLVSGIHFYYIKIDKRNLEVFGGNMDKMFDHFKELEKHVIVRYASMCFTDEQKKSLMITPAEIDYICERRDEAEETDWIVCRVTFMFFSNKDAKQAVTNNMFLDFIKHDFVKPLPMDEIVKGHPELADMKDGELRAVPKTVAEELIEK